MTTDVDRLKQEIEQLRAELGVMIEGIDDVLHEPRTETERERDTNHE